MTQPVTNYLEYRRCPICQRPSGSPCRAANGKIINGQPDGKPVDLERPHPSRRLRNVPRNASIRT